MSTGVSVKSCFQHLQKDLTMNYRFLIQEKTPFEKCIYMWDVVCKINTELLQSCVVFNKAFKTALC